MPGFDFITDEAFRTVLEADLKEMEQCFESKAWKAVHVLAGSIIEAVLIDYLIAEGHVERESALKMDFGRTIELAFKKGIISKKLEGLSSAIKEYRNLIHPGRLIRTQEATDSASAGIAKSLVEMILTEIEGRKRSNYGYTAEQIVSKIEQDSSAEAILKRLLQELDPRERERFLLNVVPERYMRTRKEPDGYERMLRMLPVLFRTAYDQANSQLQVRAAQNFVKILFEGTEEFVGAYSRAFFRMSDLQHLPDSDAQAVKDYFFAQIKSSSSDHALLGVLSGIGKHLLPEEISAFVDPLVHTMSFGNTESKGVARKIIENEFHQMEEEVGGLLHDRLDKQLRRYRVLGIEDPMHIALVKDIKSSLGLDGASLE